MATLDANSLGKLSIVSTLVDAAVELARGRRKSGAVLLAAAALGSRFPGVGTAASVAIRILRRLRR